jgi:hypothetical protein
VSLTSKVRKIDGGLFDITLHLPLRFFCFNLTDQSSLRTLGKIMIQCLLVAFMLATSSPSPELTLTDLASYQEGTYESTAYDVSSGPSLKQVSTGRSTLRKSEDGKKMISTGSRLFADKTFEYSGWSLLEPDSDGTFQMYYSDDSGVEDKGSIAIINDKQYKVICGTIDMTITIEEVNETTFKEHVKYFNKQGAFVGQLEIVYKRVSVADGNDSVLNGG